MTNANGIFVLLDWSIATLATNGVFVLLDWSIETLVINDAVNQVTTSTDVQILCYMYNFYSE